MEGGTIIKIHLFIAVLLVLFASSAYAAIEATEANVTVPIDYGDFNDNDQTFLSKTVQFTVRNTGSENVTVQTTLSGLPSGYTVGSIGNTLVTAGSTATIAFNLNIPHQKNAGTENIGTIILTDTATGTELIRVPLIQTTKSMLELSEVAVDYIDEDDESQRDEFDENDATFDVDNKVLIGTEVSVTFDIKNLFDQEYGDDGTLENIELSFDVDDDDLYQEAIDDEYSFDDLDGEDSSTFTVAFTVSDEAETKDYEIDITIEAEDGNNAIHTVERTLTLTVERRRDDVRVTKATITPLTATACDSTVTLDTTIRNIGSSRQRNVVLSVTSPTLAIDARETGIELDPFDDNDDSFNKRFTFPLRAPTARTHILTIRVTNNNEQLDIKTVELPIGACPSAQPPQEEEEEQTAQENTSETAPSVTQPPEQTSTETVTSFAIAETIENPFTREDMFAGLFIIAIILTLGLIIIFFIILLK